MTISGDQVLAVTRRHNGSWPDLESEGAVWGSPEANPTTVGEVAHQAGVEHVDRLYRVFRSVAYHTSFDKAMQLLTSAVSAEVMAEFERID
jgi:hypothetical protein